MDELVTRLDGLLDTGTTALLAGVVPEVRVFIHARCEVLRSLVVVIRAMLLAELARRCAASFDRLLAACERLGRSLVELAAAAQHGTADSTIVTELRSVVAEIVGSTRIIADAAGVHLPGLDGRQAYRERIFDNIAAVLAAPPSNTPG